LARPRLLLRRNTVGFLCSVGPGSISAQILAAPGPTTGRTTGRIGCRQILITEATNRWSTFDVGEYKRSGPRTGARSILPRGLPLLGPCRKSRSGPVFARGIKVQTQAKKMQSWSWFRMPKGQSPGMGLKLSEHSSPSPPLSQHRSCVSRPRSFCCCSHQPSRPSHPTSSCFDAVKLGRNGELRPLLAPIGSRS